jgi:hypothetical protein
MYTPLTRLLEIANVKAAPSWDKGIVELRADSSEGHSGNWTLVIDERPSSLAVRIPAVLPGWQRTSPKTFAALVKSPVPSIGSSAIFLASFRPWI